MTRPGPVRVQRRRTRGWRMPPGAVYVGRPTRWGNPYRADEHGPAAAVELYRARLLADPVLLAATRARLVGRVLACWCALDAPCHADVLLDLANTTPDGVRPRAPESTSITPPIPCPAATARDTAERTGGAA